MGAFLKVHPMTPPGRTSSAAQQPQKRVSGEHELPSCVSGHEAQPLKSSSYPLIASTSEDAHTAHARRCALALWSASAWVLHLQEVKWWGLPSATSKRKSAGWRSLWHKVRYIDSFVHLALPVNKVRLVPLDDFPAMSLPTRTPDLALSWAGLLMRAQESVFACVPSEAAHPKTSSPPANQPCKGPKMAWTAVTKDSCTSCHVPPQGACGLRHMGLETARLQALCLKAPTQRAMKCRALQRGTPPCRPPTALAVGGRCFVKSGAPLMLQWRNNTKQRCATDASRCATDAAVWNWVPGC
eukprot:scaffold72510_cov19-Tisochrysis_lutea.AAC.1